MTATSKPPVSTHLQRRQAHRASHPGELPRARSGTGPRRISTAATSLFCVVDLHALTVDHDPARVRRLSRQTASLLLAVGAGPRRVHGVRAEPRGRAHPAVVPAGVRRHGRRDAADDPVQGEVGAGAGDRAERTAVAADVSGADGRGHPGVPGDRRAGRATTRRSTWSWPGTWPSGSTSATGTRSWCRGPRIPQVAARVMDLQDPTSKMGKSHDAPAGIDLPARRTRGHREEGAPGGDRQRGRGCPTTGRRGRGWRTCWRSCRRAPARSRRRWRTSYDGIGALKADTAEAVVELLRPLRARHAEISADPSYVDEVLREGAARARALARPTVDAAYGAIGLLPRRARTGRAGLSTGLASSPRTEAAERVTHVVRRVTHVGDPAARPARVPAGARPAARSATCRRPARGCGRGRPPGRRSGRRVRRGSPARGSR